MDPAAAPHSLLADIGGTNTRVALARGATLLPDTIRRFRNADYPGLEAVLRAYLAERGESACHAACVAVAGPVKDGVGALTNLDWSIDEATLAGATGAGTVAILNDLQAQGHALGHIAQENLRPVLPGVPAPEDATRLVIGVGTGFNVAPVHSAGAARVVAASETGHSSLPLRTLEDKRLGDWLAERHGFPAVEEVLSGRGLTYVYAWLGDEAGDPRTADAATIMEACAAGSDPRAEAAVARFVHFLGCVAGDQALIHLPFGGIYLAGGVARAMAPWLDRFGFAESFRDKGRFAGFLESFPVQVIEDDFAALAGTAAHLARIAPAPAA